MFEHLSHIAVLVLQLFIDLGTLIVMIIAKKRKYKDVFWPAIELILLL